MNFYNFMIRSYRYEESIRGILARAMIFNRPILPHVDRGEFGDRGYMAWKNHFEQYGADDEMLAAFDECWADYVMYKANCWKEYVTCGKKK